MALTRLATPVAGQTIDPTTHYTTEFDNIYTNALSLISPLTGTLNANNNQISNARLENVTATPTAAQAGRAVWHTTFKQLELDDGAQIRYIPAHYGITTGDLQIATSTSQFGRLAVGSAAQLIQVSGGLPAWTSSIQPVSIIAQTVAATTLAATTLAVGSGGSIVSKILTTTGACIWPAMNAAATIATTITVTGATGTDQLLVSHSAVTAASVLLYGYVSATNTVTVSLYNGTGAVYNPGSGTLRVTLFQYA